MHLLGILGVSSADTSLLNECIVVAVSQGKVAGVLLSNSAWYVGRECSQWLEGICCAICNLPVEL